RLLLLEKFELLLHHHEEEEDEPMVESFTAMLRPWSATSMEVAYSSLSKSASLEACSCQANSKHALHVRLLT
ncbi:hypothetical protein Dimus_010476, partial [Dionaea muscipula]